MRIQKGIKKAIIDARQIIERKRAKLNLNRKTRNANKRWNNQSQPRFPTKRNRFNFLKKSNLLQKPFNNSSQNFFTQPIRTPRKNKPKRLLDDNVTIVRTIQNTNFSGGQLPKQVIVNKSGLISVTSSTNFNAKVDEDVEMEDLDAEEDDLEKLSISDLPEIKPKKILGEHSSSIAQRLGQPFSSSSHQVLVSNLHSSVTQEDINELFGDVGTVIEAAMTRPGTATVTFSTREEAVRACEAYHKRHLDGLPMYCMLVDREPTTSFSQRLAGRVGPPRNQNSEDVNFTVCIS